MSVFLAMAPGWADAAPSPWFWRPHMTPEASGAPALWSRPKQQQKTQQHTTSGMWKGLSGLLGGCLGHAAERQSCLQRDVINYSETALKGPRCVPAGRHPLCSSSVLFHPVRRSCSSRKRVFVTSAAEGNGLFFGTLCGPLMTWEFSGYSI